MLRIIYFINTVFLTLCVVLFYAFDFLLSCFKHCPIFYLVFRRPLPWFRLLSTVFSITSSYVLLLGFSSFHFSLAHFPVYDICPLEPTSTRHLFLIRSRIIFKKSATISRNIKTYNLYHTRIHGDKLSNIIFVSI